MNLYILILFLFLVVFWIILTHSFYWVNILIGSLLSILSLFISKRYLFRFHFSPKKISYKKISKYIWILLVQIVLSALRSLHTIVTFQTHVQIVKIHTQLQDDFSIFILANSITLTPGTITLLREGQNLFVLCLYKLPSSSKEAGAVIKDHFETILLEE